MKTYDQIRNEFLRCCWDIVEKCDKELPENKTQRDRIETAVALMLMLLDGNNEKNGFAVIPMPCKTGGKDIAGVLHRDFRTCKSVSQ